MERFFIDDRCLIIFIRSDIRETKERIDARKSRNRGKVGVMGGGGGNPPPHLVTKHFFLVLKVPLKRYKIFLPTKKRLINGE